MTSRLTNHSEIRFRLRAVLRNQIRKAAAFVNLSRPRTNAREAQFSAKTLLIPLIAAAGVMSSCSTPATRTETVEVKIPVATQPITPAQVPTPPAPLPPRPSNLSAAADTLLSKVCELESYVLRADPLLRVSAGEKLSELPKYPECEH